MMLPMMPLTIPADNLLKGQPTTGWVVILRISIMMMVVAIIVDMVHGDLRRTTAMRTTETRLMWRTSNMMMAITFPLPIIVVIIIMIGRGKVIAIIMLELLPISLVSVILMAVVLLRSPWTMSTMMMMTIIMMLILRTTTQHVVGCPLSKLSAGMVRGIIGSIM